MARGFKTTGIFRIFLVVFAIACANAEDSPRTLYKPGDIENARLNIELYGWARDIVGRWERRTRFAMRQDREFFEGIIPGLTPGNHYGQNCPSCVDPVSRRQNTSTLVWRVTDFNRITCGECGVVYPGEEYPETGVIECPRMGQVFTYYQTPGERALPPGAGPEEKAEHALLGVNNRPTPTSMSGLIRYRRAMWAVNQALLLARLYAVTEDAGKAERTAWILDRFARTFPEYLYHTYTGSIADLPPAEVAENMGRHPRGGRFPPEAVRHPYGLNQHSDARGEYSTMYNGFWGAGRIRPHGKGSDAGPLLDMTVAYDLTRRARYPDGTPVYGAEMHERIVRDLLTAGCEDYEHWDDLSNKGVTSRSLSAAVGVLLGQPWRVRRGLEGLNRVLEERFHFDGFYGQSPAYAVHNYLNMGELPDILHGYSDPPGYLPDSGERIDNLDVFGDGRLNLALLSKARLLAPGNRLPVIGNTRYDTKLNPVFAEILLARLGPRFAGLLEAAAGSPLSEWGGGYSLWYRPPETGADEPEEPLLRSEWFPGWHVGVLRGWDKNHQTALFLTGNENNWTVRTGHRHMDILNLGYYAFGEEMVSDRGYFSGSRHLTPGGLQGQQWVQGTMSHNLVVVDEKNQNRRQSGSNLELFGRAPGIEVLQASGFRAYEQCAEYRRTCAHVLAPGGGHYIVDFFRVAGGRVHQYSFHCNGVMSAIKPESPGPAPAELSDEWARWLKNPESLSPRSPRTFTWRHNGVNLDLMLLNTDETIDRIIIADAPGWRRSGPPSEFRKPPIKQLLAENRASGGDRVLSTLYAAVIVPYRSGLSPVMSAELLGEERGTGAAAVRVRFPGRTDYIISAKDQEPRQYGPVSAAGEFAFVSVDDRGAAVSGYLLNGTLLEYRDMRITLEEPSSRLRVESVEGGTYNLEEPFPAGLAETASLVIACGPPPRRRFRELPRPLTGFEIESIACGSISARGYPVPECDEITVLHSAWKSSVQR